MLLTLTRPSRSTDLSHLDIVWKQYKPDGAMFLPSALAKQSCQGKEVPGFFFHSFPDDMRLSLVRTLKDYEKRKLQLKSGETLLRIATIKQHKPVTSCFVGRWLKALLEEAGVNTSIFNAHSVKEV